MKLDQSCPLLSGLHTAHGIAMICVCVCGGVHAYYSSTQGTESGDCQTFKSSSDYTVSSRTSWITEWDPVSNPFLLHLPPPQLESDRPCTTRSGLLKSHPPHPNGVTCCLLPFLWFPLILQGELVVHVSKTLLPDQVSRISLPWAIIHGSSFHSELLVPWSLRGEPMVVPVLLMGNWSLVYVGRGSRGLIQVTEARGGGMCLLLGQITCSAL